MSWTLMILEMKLSKKSSQYGMNARQNLKSTLNDDDKS